MTGSNPQGSSAYFFFFFFPSPFLFVHRQPAAALPWRAAQPMARGGCAWQVPARPRRPSQGHRKTRPLGPKPLLCQRLFRARADGAQLPYVSRHRGRWEFAAGRPSLAWGAACGRPALPGCVPAPTVLLLAVAATCRSAAHRGRVAAGLPRRRGASGAGPRLFGWALSKCRPLRPYGAQGCCGAISSTCSPGTSFTPPPGPCSPGGAHPRPCSLSWRVSSSCGFLAVVGARGSVQSWHPALLLGPLPSLGQPPWSCSQGPGLGTLGSSQLRSLHPSSGEGVAAGTCPPPPPPDHSSTSCALCPQREDTAQPPPWLLAATSASPQPSPHSLGRV